MAEVAKPRPPNPSPNPPWTPARDKLADTPSMVSTLNASVAKIDNMNGAGRAPSRQHNNTSLVRNLPPDKLAGLRMSPASPTETEDGSHIRSPIDPISRQILERTQSKFGSQPNSSSYPASGPSEERSARDGSDPSAIRRVDSTASSKLSKDKKKGVSFLSRIMGGKKRDDPTDVHDTVSEISDNRSAGIDAEVFSAPIGYIPRFAPPPKYIKVKAINRKRRDLDRLFLAQRLQDGSNTVRKTSIDSKIHDIADIPHVDPTSSSKSTTNAIWAMEFSKDGKYLAAAGQDKKLRVWEVISSNQDREGDDKENEEVKLNAPVFKQKLIREYDGHISSILDLSWSKNNFLLSSSMDKTVRLYHVSRPECLCAFKHNDFVTSIQFHPRDDRFFLAGSLDSKIRLWSIPDKTVAYWQPVPDMVTAVAFTPDGKTSIAGCLNGMCILYDTEGLRAHSQIHVKSARGRNSKGSKITGIDTIAITRENGQSDVKLLITSNDSRIRMYNLRDRNLEIKFRGNENTCSQIHASFSDDGKFVICGSEDRKVYVWPTGPLERTDDDKRPMEVFEAHNTIVTSAILVPTSTRRLLAKSGDPLYDLCNPPPVTLVSRADSVISSQAPSDDKVPQSRNSESPKRAPETPAYLNRSSHPGGHIIVTADYTGEIKIFRQDCAYQKRKQDSWDGGSTFSKRMLGRTGSVHTRNSVASSLNNNRNSVNIPTGNKNQSADRILNWRNSISITGTNTNASNSAANSISDINYRSSINSNAASERARSASPGTATSGGPGKSSNWAKRLSLRRSSNAPTPLIHAPASPESPSGGAVGAAGGGRRWLDRPSITLQAPDTPDSPPDSFHSASRSPERVRSRSQNGLGLRSSNTKNKDPNNNDTLGSPISNIPTNPSPGLEYPHSPGDELYMVEGQSMMAWNVNANLIPMWKAPLRTPGVGNGMDENGNPLSRQNSVVSELSSEVVSEISDQDDENDNRGGGGTTGGSAGGGRSERDRERERGRAASDFRERDRQRETGRGSRSGNASGNVSGNGSGRDSDEVKCRSCGGTTFKATMTERGQRLRCRRCATVV